MQAERCKKRVTKTQATETFLPTCPAVTGVADDSRWLTSPVFLPINLVTFGDCTGPTQFYPSMVLVNLEHYRNYALHNLTSDTQ
jgi:hypothetical protein